MRFIDCINITGESCKAYDGNKEYISTGAVDVDHIDQNQIEIVSYDSKPSRANLITNDRSILFAKMQGTKKVLLINQELEKNIYSTGFFSVAPKQNVLNKECLYYLLGSKTFLSQKDKYCSGATQKAITLEGLKKIEITVPNLEEQGRIAEILDIINSLLESYKTELENHDKLIKARFVEMFGTLHDNKNGFEVVTIEDVCSLIKDGTHQTPQYTEDKEKGYKFLSSKDVMTQKIDWTDIKYIPAELHKKLYATIKPQRNDILMSKNGVNYGVAAVNDTDEIFDIYVSLALLRPMEIIDPIFFRCVINNQETKRQFDSSIKGIGVPNLHLGEIKKTRIFLPPMEHQKEFVAFVDQVDKSKYDAMYVDINVLEYRCK